MVPTPDSTTTGSVPVPIEREIDILKRINHRGIISIYQVFHSPRYLYMVMELATGGDLFDYIQNVGAIPEPRTRRLFKQVLSAVMYLHSNRIVHRDLKPENLLFSTGVMDVLKITDFGLARLVGQADHMTTLCGTPQYVAPEIVRQAELAILRESERKTNNISHTTDPPPPQVGHSSSSRPSSSSSSSSQATANSTFGQNKGSGGGGGERSSSSPLSAEENGNGYSGAVDLWSLGSILYVMLSAQLPFDSDSQLFEHIKKGEFTFPEEVFASISSPAKGMLTA